MAEQHISQDDINGLAQTLDELNLPDGQKALLSGIVAAAADAIAATQPEVSVEVVDPLPSFHDQFATAFTPGHVENLDAGAGGASGLKVTHAVKIGRSAES
jgi:hypothetical protein